MEIENHRAKMGPVANRVAFFDFQCAPHKSVSILALVAGDERVRKAHAESVKVALAELESFAAVQTKEVVGRTKSGSSPERFARRCSSMMRAGNSTRSLHTHCVVANATWDKSRQRWIGPH